MVPHAARMSKARALARGQAADVTRSRSRYAAAPPLGDVDGVERVQVQVDDAVGRVGDVRREPLEQAVRAGRSRRTGSAGR